MQEKGRGSVPGTSPHRKRRPEQSKPFNAVRSTAPVPAAAD